MAVLLAGRNVLPDDIERAEIFSRKRFIDDEDEGVPFRVGGSEVASGEERNAKGAKKIAGRRGSSRRAGQGS